MIQDVIKKVFLNNSLTDYLISFAIFVFGILFFKMISHFIYIKTQKLAQKTKNSFDDFLIKVLYKNLMPLVYFGVLFLALIRLNLSVKVYKGLKIFGLILFVTYGINFISSLVNFLLEQYFSKKEETALKAKSFNGVIVVLRFVLWSLSIVFLLDNFGFKISSVLAGLGIGGVAIALAAQSILGDLFSYFSILFDKPFDIGDFIIIGNFKGTIEHVGIKTTRIRSLSGEQVILSNSDLTSSRLQNYKRMDTRRVLFKIGVTYDTSLTQLEKIPNIIRDIINSVEKTKFDRAHFYEYGDFSLNFEIVYYVLDNDYNVYMDIQQKINLALFKKFAEEKIEFAFPTQTVYVEK